MKTTRYLGAVMAALSLMTASSAMAATAVRPVSTLGASKGIQRARTPIGDTAQNIFGAPLLAIFGGIVAITTIVVVATDDDDDTPTSPS